MAGAAPGAPAAAVLQGESTGSYVTRLAARNNRPAEEVLRSMGTGPVPVLLRADWSAQPTSVGWR